MKEEVRHPIILASTSPRRIELMKQIGLQCFVESPLSEEVVRRGESPQKLVARLAQEKALSVQNLVIEKYGQGLIISADTIVVAPNRKTILGKPKDKKEACRMLKALSGKTHLVYTGYCILPVSKGSGTQSLRSRKLVRVVKSKVKIRKLSSETIQTYVETGEPMDKAGSYGAQGLGTALVEKLEGSYTNVVGLPMAEIAMDLEKFKLKLFTWIQ